MKTTVFAFAVSPGLPCWGLVIFAAGTFVLWNMWHVDNRIEPLVTTILIWIAGLFAIVRARIIVALTIFFWIGLWAVLQQRLATREKWIPTRQERAGRSALFFVDVDVPAGTPNSPFLSGL
jgi:hypothetical protein